MTSLNPTMRVGRQVAEAAGSAAAALELLDAVGVPEPARRMNSYPHELSGGLRQRVMIAMAIADSPSLVIADEPTTALDVTVQAQILTLIRELRDEIGCTFLFVTHDLGVASQVADRIAVMYAGRLAELGTTEQVLDEPTHPYTRGLLRSRLRMHADRGRPLPSLLGDPPDPRDPPEGCAFAARCPLATEECTIEPPALVAARSRSAVVCLHPDAAGDRRGHRSSRPRVADGHADRGPAGRGVGGRRAQDVPAARGLPEEAGTPSAARRRPVGSRRRIARAGRRERLRQVDAAPRHRGVDADRRRRDRARQRRAPADGVPGRGRLAHAVAHRGGARRRTAARRRTSPARSGEERVADVLGLVGLLPEVAHAKVSQLSGGQRQTCRARTRATVVPPEVLLCDEPTSALDVSLAATVLNLLGRLRRRTRHGDVVRHPRPRGRRASSPTASR